MQFLQILINHLDSLIESFIQILINFINNTNNPDIMGTSFIYINKKALIFWGELDAVIKEITVYLRDNSRKPWILRYLDIDEIVLLSCIFIGYVWYKWPLSKEEQEKKDRREAIKQKKLELIKEEQKRIAAEIEIRRLNILENVKRYQETMDNPVNRKETLELADKIREDILKNKIAKKNL